MYKTGKVIGKVVLSDKIDREPPKSHRLFARYRPCGP